MYESSSNEALVLHPCCLKLPHSKTISDHGVNVTLREQVSLMRSKCQICNRRKLSDNIKGWAYVPDCGKHRHHVACVKDMIFNNFNNVQVLEPTEGSNTSTLSLQVQRSVFNGKNFRKSFQFQYVVLDEDSFMLTGVVGLICFSFAGMSRLTW
ncbi:hypothetical protein SO802_016880 [Lithocarpus litseifolius]|uniref:RING-type domain-containing protein n=1 Tax=Lithocarpus litseifolius TaxID=425828 RepID=A0AAW2D091_9ROSI